eukprot:1192305-Prorocentrum_minimum.AAC.4
MKSRPEEVEYPDPANKGPCVGILTNEEHQKVRSEGIAYRCADNLSKYVSCSADEEREIQLIDYVKVAGELGKTALDNFVRHCDESQCSVAYVQVPHVPVHNYAR